ncbi:hypothetical protein FOA52_000085 [Chlamydomonas sp. UWO 241]|nr:hypothetical protein FOA52_000085 [Chlamydomonas sp. UWO 241]
MPTTREAPITWSEARDWITDGSVGALAKLQRSRAQLDAYLAFREEQVTSEWESVLDQLTNRLYECDVTLGEGGKKRATVKRAVLDAEEPTIVFGENDFPYNFEPGMTHYVLWATKPLPRAELNAQIAARLLGRETLVFVNPPALQSIPALWHAHILARSSAESS